MPVHRCLGGPQRFILELSLSLCLSSTLNPLQHVLHLSASGYPRHAPCAQSAQSGGAIKGAAFWEWFSGGQVAPAAEGGGSGLYGINTGDATFGTVRQHAAAMKRSAPLPHRR